MAVDWGAKRIGLAVSDPLGILATGLPTLDVRGVEDAVEKVAAAAVECEAERIVVGLPLLLSGDRGSAARSAESFAQRLVERTGLPVDTYDERLTSTLSARRLRDRGVRTGHQKWQVDQGAAVALLESFLQRLAATGDP